MKQTEFDQLNAAYQKVVTAQNADTAAMSAFGVATPNNLSTLFTNAGTAAAAVPTSLAALGLLITNAVIDPVVVVTPPPPPPPTTGTGVIQALPGGKFKDAAGNAKIFRGVETWCFASTNITAMVNGVKALGANAISPLFFGTDLNRLVALCSACKGKGLTLFLNPDRGAQRAFLLQPATVTALKPFQDMLILNLETELETQAETWSESAYQADRIAMVTALRDARGTNGEQYLCPIRVGSPNYGRDPLFAEHTGAAILAADPQHNLIFACQLYWGTGYYQGLANEPSGDTGRMKQLDDFAANTALCFVPGFDATDDVGDTNEPGLMTRCQTNGLSYLHWEGRDPGGSDDDLFTDDSYTTLTPLGQSMKTRWLAEAHA